ncbi:MAG: sigma factor-like helix-turn-helix DNA-binding protein [Myxococcales bacterium]|nr:sigma factor-like helix-turn-helix DNA-binding protein [Myxococcales bacterium]
MGRPPTSAAVAAWSASGRAVGDAVQLDRSLTALHREGTEAWPALDLSLDVFAAHVARVAPADVDDAGLEALSGEGLVLCAACLAGVPAAASIFESVFLAPLTRVLSRVDGNADLAPDALQRIRAQFFAPGPGQTSAFLSYSGRGALAVWLKVLAVRAAQKLRRGAAVNAEASDEGLATLPAPDADPELRFLKQQHRRHFKACFADALAGLDQRERTVLRMSLVDGLSIDDIGKVYDVHRATAARWLTAAREHLVSSTRTRLAASLGVSEAELDEMMGAVQSNLSISLGMGLASRSEPD